MQHRGLVVAALVAGGLVLARGQAAALEPGQDGRPGREDVVRTAGPSPAFGLATKPGGG